MSNSADWERVTKAKPCSVCEHDSWCARGRLDGNVLCMRVESPYRLPNGGYLHRNALTNGKAVLREARFRSAQHVDWRWLAALYCEAATNGKIVRLANELGVSFESLRQLEIGWSGEFWTYPMYDARKIVGLMRRWPDGTKKTMEGGHLGVGIPLIMPRLDEPWFITEGASDCAALLTLGFYARWRASCTSSVSILVEMCAGQRVVIVADSDAPGLRGARVLKAKLSNATVIVPPAKDAREAIRQGWTRDDILASIKE